MKNYISQLQHLLSIANDGKDGYLKAAEETNDSKLKEIFIRYSSERSEIASELEKQIIELGGDSPNNHGSPLGKLHRQWLEIKEKFTKNDEQVILETCKNGDEFALEAYDDILQGGILTTELKPFLTAQRLIIHESFLEIDRLYFNKFNLTPKM